MANMISNLHSIFNRPWYIEENYGMSQLPILFAILDGKNLEIKNDKKKVPEFSKFAASGSFSENGNSQEKFVSVIGIKTPIYKYSQECGPRGTKAYMRIMDRMKDNDQVAGIVLDVDSGGGQAYGTPEFRDYIMDFPKPVITYTDGLLCSAAYYFASGSKEIIANKRADAIGSIGAFAQFLDLSGFYEKQGAKLHTLYADQSSEKNKSYRNILEGDYRTYIKEELNPLVDDFISDIKESRPGVKKEVFKGATYSGPKAKEMGLVDSIGTLQDAVNRVFELENKNSNSSNTMSKQQSFPNMESVLGLENPLAVTDNGSYLNDDQKNAIEKELADKDTAVKTANDAKKQAETKLKNEQESHKNALEKEKNNTSGAVQSLRDAAELAGVENLSDDATAEDISKALTGKINELNGKPGATHTHHDAEEESEEEHAYLDFENSIYNQLK